VWTIAIVIGVVGWAAHLIWWTSARHAPEMKRKEAAQSFGLLFLAVFWLLHDRLTGNEVLIEVSRYAALALSMLCLCVALTLRLRETQRALTVNEVPMRRR
jgi:hypothetical protein